MPTEISWDERDGNVARLLESVGGADVVTDLLRKWYAHNELVSVDALSQGVSGAVVLKIQAYRRDERPCVLKIGWPAELEKERDSWERWVRRQLPRVPDLQRPP